MKPVLPDGIAGLSKQIALWAGGCSSGISTASVSAAARLDSAAMLDPDNACVRRAQRTGS
jgi:hypothetical protein